MSNEWVFKQSLDSRSGGSVYGEELYQAFKARLMIELAVSTETEQVTQYSLFGHGPRSVAFQSIVEKPTGV